MRPIFPAILTLLLAACALPVRDGMVLRAPQESPENVVYLNGQGSKVNAHPL